MNGGARKGKIFNLDSALINGHNGNGGSLKSDSAFGARADSQHDHATPTDSATARKNDKKFFHYKYDIKGHSGSVYVVKFSKCGRLLASGSLDKSIRVCNLEHMRAEVMCLAEHQNIVMDLSWSEDSSALLSGAYDHTARLWDTHAAKLSATFETKGFVQSVMFNPVDDNMLWLGTTAKLIQMFDRRQPQPVISLYNDALVNSIEVASNGLTVLSGDQRGFVKTWDVRRPDAAPLFVVQNDESAKPISNVVISDPEPGDDVGRYLAVNSYDNVLRVYQLRDKEQMRLLHAVQGHKNKNWPIRSAFASFEVPKKKRGTNGADDSVDADRDTPMDDATDKSLVLATGSADNSCYCFDVGGPEGSAELLQKLEGHSDRVYGCHFNPQKPMLATYSADGTIKIWTPSVKMARQERDQDGVSSAKVPMWDQETPR